MVNKFTLLENILLRFDVIPHPLIDSLTYVILGRALQVGTKSGLFAYLEKSGTLSLNDLSKKTGFSLEGLEPILDCISALGYIRKQREKYSLTKRGQKFFSESSNSSMKNTILFSDYVFEALNDLESNAKRGGPKEVNLDFFTPRQWDVFNNTMIEIASSNAEEIAKMLPKKDSYKTLLDIGGSHGLHAIAYCKKIPGLKATVMDLAPVEPYAKKIINEKNMSNRVEFLTGDFLKDKFKGNYDVVFAFNIIHGLKSEVNSRMTKKIYNALNPGGMYVVLDQVKDAGGNSELSRVVSAAQGLMLFNQAGGKTYLFNEIKGWLEEAGFKEIRTKKLRAPGNALVFGFK